MKMHRQFVLSWLSVSQTQSNPDPSQIESTETAMHFMPFEGISFRSIAGECIFLQKAFDFIPFGFILFDFI
jgi:hypothetical protein